MKTWLKNQIAAVSFALIALIEIVRLWWEDDDDNWPDGALPA